MDNYTYKKITSIDIQLRKLGINFIDLYGYDFEGNYTDEEPGVQIDWFFQNSTLFTKTIHKFPDELSIEEFVSLYNGNLLSKQGTEYFYDYNCKIYNNNINKRGYTHIGDYLCGGRFAFEYNNFQNDYAIPIAVRKVNTNSNLSNSLLPILFGKRIVLEDCSVDLCYFENMNLVIPIEKYFRKSMNIYDLKKCDEYKEETWSFDDLVRYIQLKKQSEQNDQQHIVDIAHDSIMDMLGNEEDIDRVKPKIR